MVGVSQDQLHQIPAQLRSLVATANVSPPPPLVPVGAPSCQAPQSSFQSLPSVSSTPAPAPDSIPPAADCSSLLSTLLKAGIVSNSGTPVGAGATVHEQSEHRKRLTADMERDAERSYHDFILSHRVQLSTLGITQYVKPSPTKIGCNDFNRTSPAIADILYAEDSTQCKQCGIRYPDIPVGFHGALCANITPSMRAPSSSSIVTLSHITCFTVCSTIS